MAQKNDFAARLGRLLIEYQLERSKKADGAGTLTSNAPSAQTTAQRKATPKMESK